MKKLYCLNTCSKGIFLFFICLTQIAVQVIAQSPITQIGYSNNSIPTQTETNINGAGYSFSQWITGSNFTVNYGTTAANDILSITSFTAGGNNYIPLTSPNALIKVRRAANAAVNDQRNFITYWSKCSTFPLPAALFGTIDCDAPKITSMEAAMSTNNINSGYDNLFNNTISAPHYGNIERVDYVVPNGFLAINTPDKAGFAVFDRGGGDDFKMAAITAVDASGNPSAYKTLITVPASKFSATGLLQSSFDYIIFVSDPNVASGQSRPSTKSNQNIKGVYISFQDLGIAVNETIYGYSLFGQDVDPGSGHVLTDPSTFPVNSSFGGALDPLNVFTLFQSGIVVLPVKLNSFAGIYNKSGKTVDLKWTTSSEQGLKYFTVEKSNNSTDWVAINNLNASGNNTGSHYFFTDKNLGSESNLYYRLKMRNDDGSIQYSDIVFLRQPQPDEINLMISKTGLVIKTEIEVREVKVFDMSGNLVTSQTEKKSGGDIEISISSLPPGMYIVVLADRQNTTYTKKFLKI